MDVTVVAGSGRYAGGARLPSREDWRGVHVHRVRCTSLGRASAGRRLTDYATYFILAAARVIAMHPPDVVVCLSTPPLLALLGAMARRRGARFVYKVEDLYPDVAFALGALRERSVLGRALAWLSRAILARADAVVALDGAMAETLHARGARRVEVIPNWADGQRLRLDLEAGERFRREECLEGRFVVLYAGNLGRAHRFDTVLGAAKALAGREPRVLFLFVGDGERLAEVRAASLGSANVKLMPYQPAARLNALFNAADIHLVTLRDEAAGLLVPSKYASALAAGKPVLMAGARSSAMAQEIERERLGFSCGHDAEQIATAVLAACGDPVRVRRQGEHAREVFTTRYDRTMATAQWHDLIGGLARSSMRVEGDGG
ncbi:MAG: glycosyltransferase WbuB [Acidobacteria bacterium]|nr:MAG: glycosyltransferase WbuB [Acidobacteriota bacterium]